MYLMLINPSGSYGVVQNFFFPITDRFRHRTQRGGRGAE